MPRPKKVLAWSAGVILLTLLLVGVVGVLLVQSRPGHTFVLRSVLAQSHRFMEGELEVRGIRSDGLLRGFSLRGVVIRDDRGRPFLEADSVQVRYSARHLLRRELAFIPADIWGARVVLETLHGDEASNVARIFAPERTPEEPAPEPDEEPSPSAFTLSLERFTLHRSEVTIRIPVEEAPAAGMRAEEVEGYPGLYQRLDFRDVDLRVGRADILNPELPGERIRIDGGSFVGHVFEEPFQVEDLRGVVERAGSRITFELDRFWFPGSELAGLVVLDWSDPEGELHLEVGLEANPVRFEDFRWIEPRLPEGGGRLALRAEGPVAGGEWRVSGADLEMEGSRVRGGVGIRLGDELRFTSSELELAPLNLALLDEWLPEPLPVGGRVAGRARFSGPLAELQVDGRLTWDDPGAGVPSSTVEARGTLHLEGVPGVTGLSVTVDPFRLATLDAFSPDLELRGEGSLRAELSGRLDTGLRVTADLEHHVSDADGAPHSSRIRALGSVREVAEDYRLALDVTLSPLSLDGVTHATARELPARGLVAGTLRVEGPLSELGVEGRLDSSGGVLNTDVHINARDPLAGYRGSVSTSEFRLDEVMAGVPDSTWLTGTLFADGRGGTTETLEGTFRIHLRDSRVRGAQVERAEAELRAEAGVLRLERLELVSPLMSASGAGTLGLRGDAPSGVMEVAFRSEEVERLRPILFGDEETIVPDTLTALDREVLRMQGIDPDTLTVVERIPLGGSVAGEVTLEGWVNELTARGWVELHEALYGEGELEEGRVDFVASWAGAEAWQVEGVLDLDQVRWDRWAFPRVSGEVSRGPTEGTARLDLVRGERESYRLRARATFDSVVTTVDLTTLDLDLDEVLWSLESPTRIVMEGRERFEIAPFRVTRPGMSPGDDVRVELVGVVDLAGESDLRAEVVGVELERLGRVLQIDGFPEGIMDLDIRFRGAAENPEGDATFLVREFLLEGTALSRVSGTASYVGRELTAGMEAHLDGRRLFTLDGVLPLDLALRDAGDRLPDLPMDMTLRFQEFPAATAVAFLEVLEEVQGTLDGEVHLRGSPRDLHPTGAVTLRGGALSLPELGLSPTGIVADLILRDDQTLEVTAEARARGTARISGTMGVADPMNPTFDLQIAASGFQAVDRRDLTARIGGEVTLTGSYDRPRVGGQVRVEQGAMFLEEFARTAEVIDLTDPAFFDVVDTTLVRVRPVVEAAQNPFLQNLRVDVDLSLQRDFWLRSREMNVEIGGDLIVTFDRRDREVLLVGGLEAIRGSYSAFGRQFQVEGGTVEFAGTPGINPSLDIRAVNRLRRQGGEPLNIIAQVEGTLMNLRIGLSSDAQPPIAESDLISYLIFGRPSYALASGETSILQGAAGAGVSVGIGTLATQLGSVVAQQIGVDYFTITQTQEATGIQSAPGLAGTFADTQIEVGQYVGENLFLALVLRPLTGLGGGARTQFPGARLEWRFTDSWSAEGFVEDRFAREGASGFGELGIRLSKVFGLSLYREWGY